MLQSLRIKNYAIIDAIDIRFDARMNIITGETGAGKSILVGALGLILGERADSKILNNNNEKCVVEAEFSIAPERFAAFFEEHELDADTTTILRREVSPQGKSRAFINDTPVTIQTLKLLAEKLVNLHNQHETLELVQSGFQLSVVDWVANTGKKLQDYKSTYHKYRIVGKQLEALTAQVTGALSEADFIQFQLNELSQAKLQSGEQEALEQEQGALSNAESIKRTLLKCVSILSENEGSAIEQIAESIQQLKPVKLYSNLLGELNIRLQSTYEELKDVASELSTLMEETSLDPEKLQEVEDRINLIYKLQKKHQVNTIDELIQIQSQLELKLSAVDTDQHQLKQLKAEALQLEKELLQKANELHSMREKVLRSFQNSVTVLLTKVGMPSASFKVDIQQLPSSHLNENGCTDVKFMFTANKGYAHKEIKEVASGGELSRLMLCIKSLVADAADLPTLIFDEIDSGISGDVAMKVGEIMKQLTKHHQLITITHLPQIARTADKHLFIYKEHNTERTVTRIKELSADERITEVAKMLSGSKPSEASLTNARELIFG